MKNFIKYFGLLSIIGLVLMSARCGLGGSSDDNIAPPDLTKEPITLEYWRLWDESDVLDGFINEYTKDHPNINIEVKKIEIGVNETVYDYQNLIIKLIADGTGPDIFMIHNDWLPYHINQLTPMPAGLMNVKDFKDIFPKVVQDNFLANNQIYGLPYSIDNLMLFYNTDIFSEHRIRKAPKTLQELVNLVPILTEKDNRGNIIRSAITLGETSESIPRGSDIIAALMMQYGGEMTSPDNSKATFDLPVANTNPPVLAGKEALSFYVQFADPTSPLYTYTGAKDSNEIRLFPSDVQAFMEGKAAMMLGYGYQIPNIRKFNPSLKFETAPIPQNNIQDPVTVANYWGEVVSKNSEHPNEAWDFINYMIKRSRQNSLFRLTGRIPARKDSLEINTGRKYYGSVAKQVEYSQSWYRHNSSDVEKIFDQMINNVLHDKISSRVAVETGVRDINALN